MANIKCTKCTQEVAQIISESGRLCGECLTAAVHAKLSKAVKVYDGLVHGDQVVAAISGGPCSMALAHLLSHVCVLDWARPQRGKVSCKIHIVHIDESAVLGPAAGRLAPRWKELEAQLRRMLGSASFHVVPLQDVCSGTPEEKLECLTSALKHARDATSREDLQRSLRMRLLHAIARSLECNKIVLGESCTKMASNFLAAAAKGQGYSAAADVHMADAREPVCVMKPLLNMSRKELSLYCVFNQIGFFADPLVASTATISSINGLTDAFVAELSGANRGGVSNIARTAAKLPPFAFNDARLAGAPPLRHLMQTHVRGVPQSKQLTPAVLQACQQDRQSLCDVCRKPYQSSRATGARGEGTQRRACQPCAQWVMPSDGSDSDGPGGAGARVNGSAGDTGVSLAWLADAMPRLELG